MREDLSLLEVFRTGTSSSEAQGRGEIKEVNEVIEVNEVSDDTKSSESSGKTFVDNFDNSKNKWQNICR